MTQILSQPRVEPFFVTHEDMGYALTAAQAKAMEYMHAQQLTKDRIVSINEYMVREESGRWTYFVMVWHV